MVFENDVTNIPEENSQEDIMKNNEHYIHEDVKTQQSTSIEEEFQANCLIAGNDMADNVTAPNSRKCSNDRTGSATDDIKDKAMELIDKELMVLCGKQHHDIFKVNLCYQDISRIQESMGKRLTNLVVLDLSNNNLSSLPDFLDFKKLRKLDISHNKFASIPLCLQLNFSKLVELDVSHNQLKIFYKPKCLHTLESLFLNNNPSMQIPDWFWHQEFFCLKELNLSFTDPFFEVLPIWLLNYMNVQSNGVFSNLISLDMCNTGAVMSNVAQLKYLRNIKYLQCSNDTTKVNGSSDLVNVFWELPTSFLHLSSVLELHISKVQLNVIPEEISNLLCLEVLDISHNNLHKLPDSIGSLSSLQTLNMSQNRLSMLPEQFPALQSLRTLHAQHNELPQLPAGFEALHLVYCDLYDNELPEESVSVLKQMKSLQSLDVMQNFIKQDFLPIHLQEDLRASLPETECRSLEPKIIESEVELPSQKYRLDHDCFSGYSSYSSSRSNSPTPSTSIAPPEPVAPCPDLDNSNWDDEATNSDEFNYHSILDEWQNHRPKTYEEAIQKFRIRENATYFIPSDTQIKYFNERNAVQKFDFLSLPPVEGQFDASEEELTPSTRVVR